MNRTIQPAPVRRSLTVKASQTRAFEVFTARISSWWPKSHHIGAAEPEAVLIEPREGGRWFERAPDGTECDLGKVLAWEPPGRLVLGWQIAADWRFDPKLLTEVEVNFIAEGPELTRVELEHRDLERFGETAEAMRQAVDGPNGWPLILGSYARAVNP